MAKPLLAGDEQAIGGEGLIPLWVVEVAAEDGGGLFEALTLPELHHPHYRQAGSRW